MTGNAIAEERIIFFASYGPNVDVVQDVLTKAGFASCACDTADEFCRLLDEGAAVGIIFDENLSRKNIARINNFLQNQQSWSNIAIIIFMHDLSMQIPYHELLGSHHNIVSLEIPIRTATLVDLLRR